MKAVIQRVSRAHITIDGVGERAIGPGLVILLGVKDTDTPAMCAKLAQKCAGLRIFDDENGALNLSAEDLGYEALVVSNFTLYADTKKGNAPGLYTRGKAARLGRLLQRVCGADEAHAPCRRADGRVRRRNAHQPCERGAHHHCHRHG